VLTPETRAELRAKAEKAQLAANRFANLDRGDESTPEAWNDWRRAKADLGAACDSQVILALLDASEPVAGGEFETKLRELCGYPSDGVARFLNADIAAAVTRKRDSLIASLSATHARLQSERDKLRTRLELDSVWKDGARVPAPDGIPDGISCRDETIKLLEARIERLTAERNRLAQRLGLIARIAGAGARP